MYRQAQDVSTGFCRLHYVGRHMANLLHLRVQCKLDDGRTAKVTPVSFEPLGISDLWKVQADRSAELTFRFRGKDAKFNDVLQTEPFDVTMTLQFTMSPAPYALVAGGWLPLPFVLPQRFLVDRNVVSNLRRIREHGANDGDATFEWWTKFFKGGAAIFNPLLYAYEGAQRRLPTRMEFEQAFAEGRVELLHAFPEANTVELQSAHVDAAYEQLAALAARGGRDAVFLMAVMPLILHRVARKSEARIRDQILELALKHKVVLSAPVSLAVFSCLFDDVHGSVPSIGRRLLKPKENYSLEDAYNAVSDIRHVELAALSGAVVADGQFALCTADRALAEFWTALSVRSESTSDGLLQLHYSVSTELMPRLQHSEINELATLLR